MELRQKQKVKRGDIRDGIWLMGGRMFDLLLRLIVGPVSALFLGPSILGAFKLLETIAGFSLGADLGLTKAYQREVPILTGQGDRAGVERVRGLVFTEALLITVLIIFGVWVVFLAGWRMGGVLNSTTVIVLFSLLLLLDRISTFLSKHLVSEGHFVTNSKINVLLSASRPILTIPLVVLFRLPGALTALVLNRLLSIVLCLHFVPTRIRIRLNWLETRRLLPVGFSLFFIGFSNKSFWSLELVLIPIFMGLHDTGIFALAVGALGIARTIPTSLHNIFFRNMALERGERSGGDIQYLRPYLSEQLAAYALLSAWCIGTTYLTYRFMIAVFLTEYSESLQILLILGFGMMLFQPRVFGSFILNILDRFRTIITIQIVIVVVNLLLDVLLIMRFGLWGATLGATTGFVLGGFLYTFAAERALSCRNGRRAMVIFGNLVAAAVLNVLFLYFVPPVIDSFAFSSETIGWTLVFMEGISLLSSGLLYTGWCLLIYLLVFRKEGLWNHLCILRRDFVVYAGRA